MADLKVLSCTEHQRMLFDFYAKQNSKKKASLHATYLISGKQKQNRAVHTNGFHSQQSEDTDMRSSPFPSSSAPQPGQQEEHGEITWLRSVTLAKEEDLESKGFSEKIISTYH